MIYINIKGYSLIKYMELNIKSCKKSKKNEDEEYYEDEEETNKIYREHNHIYFYSEIDRNSV